MKLAQLKDSNYCIRCLLLLFFWSLKYANLGGQAWRGAGACPRQLIRVYFLVPARVKAAANVGRRSLSLYVCVCVLTGVM